MKKHFCKVIGVLIIMLSVSCNGYYHFIISPRPVVPVVIRPPFPGEGHIWIEGEWFWNGRTYAWRDGYWARPLDGYAWYDGAWKRRGGGWYWAPGQWKKR